jgi:hypothetical protein
MFAQVCAVDQAHGEQKARRRRGEEERESDDEKGEGLRPGQQGGPEKLKEEELPACTARSLA